MKSPFPTSVHSSQRHVHFLILFTSLLITLLSGCAAKSRSLTPVDGASTPAGPVDAPKAATSQPVQAVPNRSSDPHTSSTNPVALPQAVRTSPPPVETTSPTIEGTSPDSLKAETDDSLGAVFGKTDFKGILKAPYVTFKITQLGKSEEKWALTIGEKVSPPLPWKNKAVEPGYFYLNLPEGTYVIESIAIPVGSAQAEEIMQVYFQVMAQQISYVGTLQVLGTKEKIRVGQGLPLIKPGFDYELNVRDEQTVALDDFQTYHPESPWPIIPRLMTLQVPASASQTVDESATPKP